MTNRQFLDLIGEAGDGYVLAADQPRNPRPLRLLRIGLIAACLCAALIGTAFATGAAQNLLDWLYQADDPVTYSGDISPALQELADELLTQAAAPDLEPGETYVDNGGQAWILKELDSWAQARDYLPLMDNEWLDGGEFQAAECYAGAYSAASGALYQAQIAASGTLDGYPFQIDVNLFMERDGTTISLGVLTTGDVEHTTVTSYQMACGATADFIVSPDSVSARFSAGQLNYNLSLGSGDAAAQALLKQILDSFE